MNIVIDEDQQRIETHYPGDTPAHSNGGGFPEWSVGLDAVCGPVTERCREGIGSEAVPQHGFSQRSGNGGENVVGSA